MTASRTALPVVALAALGAAAFGWFALSGGDGPGREVVAVQDGKISDRLSFVEAEEDVPVRQTRIFDTVAMFAQATAEARNWSEAPVPTLAALATPPAGRTGSTALPRMVVVSEKPAGMRAAASPPSRPVELTAQASERAPVIIRVASATNQAAVAEAPRTPVRVLGYDLPGTQHLPTRRDAARTVSYVGDKAVALGSGTVSIVAETASAVGDTVVSIGSTVAETIGIR